jgi:hypothetical protein
MMGRTNDDNRGARRADPQPESSDEMAPTLAQSRAAEFGFIKKTAQHHAALQRVREWTRARFALSKASSIVVAEMACVLPGCPPLETTIAFWIDDRRHHLKLFKPVAQVREEDLPPAWLLPSLAVPDGVDCDCC